MHKSLMDLVSALQDKQSTMVAQLHQFCEVNTATDNLAGLKIMRQNLQSVFIPLADEIQTRSFPELTEINMEGEETHFVSGEALFIRKRPELKRRVILCGHMDTVYGTNHAFQTLSKHSENHLIGPGVADMKGGLIVMLHALSAFEKTPFSTELGWDVVINADEEIGSPASSVLFAEMADNYQAGLVYEPAMNAKGTLAKNRKGSGKLTLVAGGKAAHAGRAFHEGRNAICYLAEVILAIQALNGQREGVTLNIGKMLGGEALNVVPAKATAKIDVRISQPDDENWVRQELKRIMKQFERSDYSLALHGNFGRPVKRVNQATEQLFSRVQNLSQELGLTIDWQDSGGCCDGNNLAIHGLPVLDTLGVRGGHIHSPEEYVLLDSLPERASLSALLLVDLAQGGLEKLKSKST